MKTLIMVCFVALVFIGELSPQSEWINCRTEIQGMDFLDSIGIKNYEFLAPPRMTFRVYIYILQFDNGTGGITYEQMQNAMQKLSDPFSDRNIRFHLESFDFINNSNFCTNTDENLNEIFSNNQSDGINIYILPMSQLWGGQAQNIPSNAFIIDGELSQTYSMAHEMGHCLGLYHTHAGIAFNPPIGGLHMYCEDFSTCFQPLNNSNCTECGDKVCDTPPDPCLYQKVDINCNPENLPQGYSPDTKNIMSYSRINCYEYFSAGQFERINTMINNNPILQNCIIQDIDFIFDQKIKVNNTWTSDGKIYKWLFNDFEEFTPPKIFGFIVGNLECLKSQQNMLLNQKYNNWNFSNDMIVNHYSFIFNTNQTNLTGYFYYTFNNVVIRNSIDNILFDDGLPIQFKDPWLIDYPDPSYPNPAGGHYKRNRGMKIEGPDKLEFKSRLSPFYPDDIRNYNGDIYNGVFLNQGWPNWQPPYYSVRAESVQDVTLTNTGNPAGRSHKFYFRNWSATPSGSAEFQYPNNTQTPVVFSDAGTTVQANLKGTQLTNNTNAFTSNSQRKSVRTPNGQLANIYKSLGTIWMENSTDNGQSWFILNNANPFETEYSTNPAIDYFITPIKQLLI